MNYLNYFSLSKKFKIENIQEKKFLKDIDERKFELKIFFLIENSIIFEKGKIFFYRTRDLKCSNLKKFRLSFIAKKKTNVFLCSYISIRDLGDNNLFSQPILKNVREVLFDLDVDLSSIISSGYQLLRWQRDNLFCGKCGNKNIFLTFENSLICKSKSCKKRIFPRINPTVIMNITYKEKILLARSPHWKNNLYSCLAGFCEYNESAEEAVERETYEETGLVINKIKYIFSQTWPFQNNLMLGFEAEAKESKISINRKEIEDAKWFSYSELIASVKEKRIMLPREHSIARNLINLWKEKIRN